MREPHSTNPALRPALAGTLRRKRSLAIAFRVFVTTLLMLYSVTAIYPLLWMILNSLKTQGEFILSTFALPTAPHLESYGSIFAGTDVYRALGNSLFASLVSVVFIVLLAFPISISSRVSRSEGRRPCACISWQDSSSQHTVCWCRFSSCSRT